MVIYGIICYNIQMSLMNMHHSLGRQYDKDGNLKQWWPDNVINRFKDKAQCIIDQYNNYTVKEVRMNVRSFTRFRWIAPLHWICEPIRFLSCGVRLLPPQIFKLQWGLVETIFFLPWWGGSVKWEWGLKVSTSCL